MMKRQAFPLLTVLILFVITDNAHCNLVVNGSFETPVDTTMLPPPIQYPSAYGYWTGDAVTSVGTSNGITPFDSSNMLSFLYTESALYPDSGGIQSTIAQLLNITPYLSEISLGNCNIEATAYFNRVAGDEQTDTQFLMQLYAFAGDYSTLHTQLTTGQELAFTTASIFTDSNPATWEPVTMNFTPPANTQFMAVLIHARENIFDDTGHGEFDGHYVDMVSVEVIPTPSAIILVSIGAGLVNWLRKRKTI